MAAKKIIYKEGDKIGECYFLTEDTPVRVGGRINRYALFKCFCGNIFKAALGSVRQKMTKSCGCLVKNNGGLPLHGGAVSGQSRIKMGYNCWANMKRRCTIPECDSYKDYGAKGITMYQPWFNSFEEFISHIGPRPTPKHTVDRYPNRKGNYEPGNVRWATQKQQANNTSLNINIRYIGVDRTLAEWCELFKLKYSTSLYRYNVQKLSMAAIISRGIISKVYPSRRWKSVTKKIKS